MGLGRDGITECAPDVDGDAVGVEGHVFCKKFYTMTNASNACSDERCSRQVRLLPHPQQVAARDDVPNRPDVHAPLWTGIKGTWISRLSVGFAFPAPNIHCLSGLMATAVVEGDEGRGAQES